MILNKIGYDPTDDNSKSGYQRPPKDVVCICDYFHILGFIEDDGKFMHSEMAAMLKRPKDFFQREP